LNLPQIDGVEAVPIRWIVTNPRLIKLLGDLSALPRADAAKLVSEQLLESLKIYQEVYQREYSGFLVVGPLDANGTRPSRIRVRTTTPPNGSPTLAGSRLQILGLMLIAGNLHLTEAAPAMKQVADAAFTQRDQIRGEQVWIETERTTLFNLVSLYSPTVLVTAGVGIFKPDDTAGRTVITYARSTWRPLREGEAPLPPDQTLTLWYVPVSAGVTPESLFSQPTSRASTSLPAHQ
jgi:hypothetical protein